VGYPDAKVGEQRVGVRLSVRSSSSIFRNVTRSRFERPFQLQYSCLATPSQEGLKADFWVFAIELLPGWLFRW